MIKARISIIDDEDPENFKVYETFSMLPTDKWVEGTFSLNELENYKFSFVFTKLKEKESQIERSE